METSWANANQLTTLLLSFDFSTNVLIRCVVGHKRAAMNIFFFNMNLNFALYKENGGHYFIVM